MEHSAKVWLIRVLVVVPVLCLFISVALWKHTQNEAYNTENAKRQLQADGEAGAIKLRDEIEQINIAKRELKSDLEVETTKIRGELENMQHEKRQLRLEVESAQSEKKQLRGDLEHIQEQKREILTQLEADKLKLQEQLKQVTDLASASSRDKRQTSGCNCGGAMYVQWGRTSCTGTNTELIYKGIAGGGHYTHTGAGVNLLCLPEDPIWGAPVNGVGSSTFIYGTEYQVSPNDFPFSHANAPKLHDHNVPCAVCRARTRSSVIMIPGKNVCGSGWQRAYHGYLMAGYHGHLSATEYNCVDANPEADQAGYRNEDGRLLYRVKAQCGSLPCPHYDQNRELTCAVCTK